MHRRKRIVVVTPAGRRCCMDLLKHYVLRDADISQWHLWDNCRDPVDRAYIEALDREHEKIRLVRIENPDGTNRSVNRFYRFCDDPDTFYIKMDDDIVYLQQGLPATLLAAAEAHRDSCLWWSPLVINNALCSWLLRHRGLLAAGDLLTAQASCPSGWRDPEFAVRLHQAFLDLLAQGGRLATPDAPVALARFSINCLGFFGADVRRLGAAFCPPDVDDEEWLSASLPLREGRFGRIVGSTCAAHYSFYTQEAVLNTTDILDRYYALAGLTRRHPLPRANTPRLKERLKRIARLILNEAGIRTPLRKPEQRSLHFTPPPRQP